MRMGGIVMSIMRLRLKRDVIEMEGEIVEQQNKRLKKMKVQGGNDKIYVEKEYDERWKEEGKKQKRAVNSVK